MAALGLYAAIHWLTGRDRLLALAPLLLISCAQVKEVGGDIGGHAAEWIACPFDFIDCGHVYECAQVADNPLGHVEICVDDDGTQTVGDAEAVYGAPCVPTPRHEGLCIWGCGADAPSRGANAYNGEFCP